MRTEDVFHGNHIRMWTGKFVGSPATGSMLEATSHAVAFGRVGKDEGGG